MGDDGVLAAGFRRETDAIWHETEWADADLAIHAEQSLRDRGPHVFIATTDAAEDSCVHLSLSADEADRVAEQLQEAAEHVREGERADVRL